MKIIYVDNAATTAMSNAAIEAMEKSMREDYGNPSSLHSMGQGSAEKVRAARESVAKNLGCSSNEIYFTSGGTEADNWAIRSCAKRRRKMQASHCIHKV
jgi:cysteine desulfurase